MRSLAMLLAAIPVIAVAQTPAAKAPFVLMSPDIKAGAKIPESHVLHAMGCTGNDVSPALSWSGAPAATKSLALTIYDPDAPTGSGWWHWSVYNIPANVTSLAEGAGDSTGHLLPAGAMQGPTDFGRPGYGGPCPPKGEVHHYHFTLFALDVDKLDIPPGVTAAYVGFNLHMHTIATAKLTAIYSH